MINEEINSAVTEFKQLTPAIQDELLDLMREMVLNNNKEPQTSGAAV